MLSVIICTYNPREDYLQRTLDGLKAQTLPPDQWEFLLIDNRLEKPLAERVDLSWHPNSRIIREEELGLTPARLRGIRESVGELLVFVDDDNVLNPEYLSAALEIAGTMPHIGVWGGQNIGEFEVPFPPYAEPYRPFLALQEVAKDRWSNLPFAGTSPCGAGMCVRRKIAEHFAAELANNPSRRRLGRTGTNLTSSEDVDLAMTSIDLGLGIGLFSRLRLIHIIPKSRLEISYLRRLAENISHSQTMLSFLRHGTTGKDTRRLRRKLIDRFLRVLQTRMMPAVHRRFAEDLHRGKQRAYRDIAQMVGAKGFHQ